MITVNEAFETFRQRLELSETERTNASKRHTEVRACIRANFSVDRDCLTGSYDRHTKTKPLKDVDIFFALGEKEKKWRESRPARYSTLSRLPSRKIRQGAVDPRASLRDGRVREEHQR